MAEIQLWSVEMRLPPLGDWEKCHNPWAELMEMTEEEADNVISIYKRAMPMKEFRKTFVWYDPDKIGAEDDDIPF